MTTPARRTESRYRMDLRPHYLRVTPSPVGGFQLFSVLQLGMDQKGPMPTVEEVKPVEGERWTFEIKSRSRPTQKPWRVDLEAYNWNGSCDCEDFRFSREPDLSRGAKPGDDYRCYHILQARSYVMEEIFPMLAKALGGPRMPTPGEGTSKMTRAKDAIQELHGRVANLMDLRQMITGLIDQCYETETDSDPSPEPNRASPKIYHLEDERTARRYQR